MESNQAKVLYGIWCQPKDGSLNGVWQHSGSYICLWDSKDLVGCEVERSRLNCPGWMYEAREYEYVPKKQDVLYRYSHLLYRYSKRNNNPRF